MASAVLEACSVFGHSMYLLLSPASALQNAMTYLQNKVPSNECMQHSVLFQSSSVSNPLFLCYRRLTCELKFWTLQTNLQWPCTPHMILAFIKLNKLFSTTVWARVRRLHRGISHHQLAWPAVPLHRVSIVSCWSKTHRLHSEECCHTSQMTDPG